MKIRRFEKKRKTGSAPGGGAGWRLALRLFRVSFRRESGLKFGHVESLIDDLWHRFDLSAQLFLDGEKVVAVLVGDQINGQSEVPEPSRAANAVQVGLRGLGEVEIDDHIHRLDIDASCQ